MKQPDRNLYFEWTLFDLILHFDSPLKMVPGVHCSIAPPLLRRAGEFSEDSAVSVFLPRHCFSFPSPDVALGRSAGRGRLDLKGKERRGGHQQCGPLQVGQVGNPIISVALLSICYNVQKKLLFHPTLAVAPLEVETQLLGIFLPGSQIPNESLVGKVPLIRAGAPLKAAVLLWRRRRRRRGRCIWPKEGEKNLDWPPLSINNLKIRPVIAVRDIYIYTEMD